jgi:hypothetical protein
VRTRLAYLLHGVAPGWAATLAPPSHGEVRFGPRGPLRRHHATLEAVRDLTAESCDGLELGGIRFGVEDRRGQLHLTYATDLMPGTSALSSKLDVGPPPGLAPEDHPWVPITINERYGGPVPQLPVDRVERWLGSRVGGCVTFLERGWIGSVSLWCSQKHLRLAFRCLI